MSSKNPPLSPKPKNKPDAQAVKDFFIQLKALASAAGFDAVVSIHTENTKLRDQVSTKDQEIGRLKSEMAALEEQKRNELREMTETNERKISKQEERKEIALNMMHDHMEKEKRSHKETKNLVESLENTVKEKETHITQLKRTADELKKQVENLELDGTSQRGKLATAQKDYDALQHKLKERDTTIDTMKEKGVALEKKLSAFQTKAKDLKDESHKLQESLERTKAGLAKIEGFAAGHMETNEDQLLDNFVRLWEDAKTELYSRLTADLPSDALRNTAAWEKLRQTDLARESQIPLPCSNTQAAKQMRLAFILAILARQIDKYIFQPTYITPTDDDNKLRQFLNDQAAKDSEKESFCRSMLLSMDSDTQARTCVENVHLVVRNVSAYLDELLAEDQRHTFHEFLRKVVQKASEIWKPIQCSRRRFEPDFEPPLADDVWLPFAVPGSDKATAENGASKRYKNCRAISVFPRLSVIENDASTAYTAIIQLTSVHNQWMDADREMVQEPPSPTIGRVGLLRRTIANPKGLTISSGSSKKGGG